MNREAARCVCSSDLLPQVEEVTKNVLEPAAMPAGSE